MARVTIELPSLLAPLVEEDPPGQVPVEADTVAGALEALIQRHPGLRVHLFDESGALRQHVLCFRNGTNTRWGEAREAPLAESDRIRILQAVSGG